MKTRKSDRHSANKKAVNFYIEIDLLNAISKVKFAPPGHEDLEPQDLSTRLKFLIRDGLKHRGIKVPVDGRRAFAKKIRAGKGK